MQSKNNAKESLNTLSVAKTSGNARLIITLAAMTLSAFTGYFLIFPLGYFLMFINNGGGVDAGLAAIFWLIPLLSLCIALIVLLSYKAAHYYTKPWIGRALVIGAGLFAFLINAYVEQLNRLW